MSLNLIKLCVGIESAEQLQELMVGRKAAHEAAGTTYEPIHTTRMLPKRRDELLDGGSLYWVMKGQVRARQKLVDIRPFTDGEGISRCDLVLSTDLVFTQWQPRRAFQGWRYLKVEDAPADLDHGQGADTLPLEVQRELAELGLL
ncbi:MULTISPECIES: DUF1489 family protein [unclassified Lentilitoribacter]|jgi:hypothetical protein|uniref:DUF1489 family protein n=1 Tax=unclassified Lentilitoribacter TaxID=2647570 RepID=UPI0013A6A17B|nr:DUF1489 family protein [Lentilitoribacter sp. Alg239-R112]